MSELSSEGLVSPQAFDAEESILGAMTLAPGAIEAVREILDPGDFYRESHGKIYRAAVEMHGRGEPVDPITLVAELDRLGLLEDVGGRSRIHELAALVPTVANVGYYARLVRDAADSRAVIRAGGEVAKAGWDRDDPAEAIASAEAIVAALGERERREGRGMTTAAVLAAEVEVVPPLVDGLIESGSVGDFTGLPTTYKSFTAQATAFKVSAGEGRVLDRFDVVRGGPVGYFWADDSTANEIGRVRDYADRHGYADASIRWYLNDDVRLPRDLGWLRREVEREGFVLVVFDSLYDFLGPEVSLKDESVAQIVVALKREISDRTGATVLLVDHAAWPGENGIARRAYGSVFKAAAVRWSVFFERDDEKGLVFVSGRGNNLRGLKREPFVFDEEALELRPVAPSPSEAVRSLDEEIIEWLAANPGSSKNKIAAGVGGRKEDVLKRVTALTGVGRIVEGPKYAFRVAAEDRFPADGNRREPVPGAGDDDPVLRGGGVADGSPLRSRGEPAPREPVVVGSRGTGSGARPPTLGRPGYVEYAVEACRTEEELREALGLHAEAAAAAGDVEEAERTLDVVLADSRREGSS